MLVTRWSNTSEQLKLGRQGDMAFHRILECALPLSLIQLLSLIWFILINLVVLQQYMQFTENAHRPHPLRISAAD